MAELSPDFVDAGWDELDLLDAYMVLDDVLDDFDDKGYGVGSRGGPSSPTPPKPPPEPPREPPTRPRPRPRPGIGKRIANGARKFFRRIFGG